MKTSRLQNKHILVEIRNKLGLSQQQLADYLQVTRTTVNMAERSERPLPTDAFIKVAKLEIRMAAIVANGNPQVKQLLPQEADWQVYCEQLKRTMIEEQFRCRRKEHKISASLWNMERTYEQTLLFLQLVQATLDEGIT